MKRNKSLSHFRIAEIIVALAYTMFLGNIVLATNGCGSVNGKNSDARVDGPRGTGTEGGPCFTNGKCNIGLTCYSGLCVRVNEAGTSDGILDIQNVDGKISDLKMQDIEMSIDIAMDYSVKDILQGDVLNTDVQLKDMALIEVGGQDQNILDISINDTSIPDLSNPDILYQDSKMTDGNNNDSVLDVNIPDMVSDAYIADLYQDNQVVDLTKQMVVKITVDNTGNVNALKNYPIQVIVNHLIMVQNKTSRNDAGDIRFMDSNGSTMLGYWIEEGINTTKLKAWVKIPLIPANSSKTIYLNHGNLTLSSKSKPDDVFFLYDQFDGTTLDSNKWEIQPGANVSLNSGTSTISGSNWSAGIWTKNKISFPAPFLAETRIRHINSYEVHVHFDIDGGNGSLMLGDSDHNSLPGFQIATFGSFGSFYKATGTTTTAFKVYSGIADDKAWVAKRGDTLSTQNEILTSALNTSADKENFYVTLARGLATIEIDWIRVRPYSSKEPKITVN